MNLHNTSVSIIKAIRLQLALSMIALPILLSWGLGISALTIISNIIFTPVLALFLLVSTTIFIGVLLGFECSVLKQLLNLLTRSWDWVLCHAGSATVITVACPHPAVLFGITACSLLLLFRWRHKDAWQHIMICGSTLIIIFALGFAEGSKNQKITGCWRASKNVRVIPLKQQRKLIVIDSGFFGRHTMPARTVTYQFIPLLIKKYGTAHLAELRLNKIGYRSLKAAYTLCKRDLIDALWLAQSPDDLPDYADKLLNELKNFCKEKNIRIVYEG